MNIYVGNLSYNTGDAELEALFGEFGQVSSAQVITDRDTGRSRGFGFVEMPDDEEARNAMEGLNGKDIDGRNLTVNEARPKADRGGARGGSGGGGRREGGGGRRGGGMDRPRW